MKYTIVFKFFLRIVGSNQLASDQIRVTSLQVTTVKFSYQQKCNSITQITFLSYFVVISFTIGKKSDCGIPWWKSIQLFIEPVNKFCSLRDGGLKWSYDARVV